MLSVSVEKTAAAAVQRHNRVETPRAVATMAQPLRMGAGGPV